MMAALVRGQRFRAGLCVAGAICLKIFPAYLLIVPLLRRDLRCLTGCAVGLFLGLVAIPVAAWGHARPRLVMPTWPKSWLAPPWDSAMTSRGHWS